MPTRPIRFFHRGRIVELADAPTTRSVLDWLRDDARCSGTKEGCNEGDCGACTVVIGEPAGRVAGCGDTAASTVVGGLSLRAVNACIQLLPTLDGKALFSVEDVGGPGALHPVQRSLVDCHGSQCGFCTPGFVMSMWASYERHCEHGTRPTRRELADELSGNLCRCTGYRPILDAGERMFELPPARLDTRPVLDALKSIESHATFHYEAANPSLPGTPRERYHAPRTLDALAAELEESPDARILAGSTDIGLWVNKQLKALPELVYVGEVQEMKRIETRAGGLLSIGAAATLEDAWSALAARHPPLREMGLRFASVPVRNAGTMGGNVANGSPIGDSAPVLLALDARLVLRHGARERRLPIADFYVDYMKNRLEPGEFLQAIEVPPATPGLKLRAYKLSKRYDCDISALAAGFAIALDGDTVRHVRLGFGGMAATCKRALQAEQAIAGRPWNEATLRTAQAALDAEFTPLTDLRASRDYRATAARNLLERFWLETRAQDALKADALNVWAAA